MIIQELAFICSIFQVTRGVNPKTSVDQGGAPSSLAAETTYISEKEERGLKGRGWKGRITQALQKRPQTPGSATESPLTGIITLSLLFFLILSCIFTICYRSVSRPMRGHELQLSIYLLLLYTTASICNRRTQTFEPSHSNKRIFQPLFGYPAFAGLRLRCRARAVAFRGCRGISVGHDSRNNMVFVPFAQEQTKSKPWSSISTLNMETYSKYTARYMKHIDGRSRQSIETGSIRVLRVVSIIATGQLTDGTAPTNVWKDSIWSLGPLRHLKNEVGSLADYTFVQLSKPQPDREWYTKLLAARDTLFDLWVSFPHLHTGTSTSILILLCNTLAMLDLRNLATRDANGRRIAANLTNAMDFTVKQIFRRPKCMLKEKYTTALFNFIQLQLQGITGTGNKDDNAVYLLLANGKPYVGRTTLHRHTQKNLPGVGPRWSEHVRELHQQMYGNPGDRGRRRYRNLQHQQGSACMNIIILD